MQQQPSAPLIPGGVADFNNSYNKKSSAGSSLSADTMKEQSESNDASHRSSLNSSDVTPSCRVSEKIERMAGDAIRREARKERVKEKLHKYKHEQKQLRQSCTALEKQLAETTEKLREVDSRSAFKIDSLESELRETRMGMDRVANQSTKEVTDQSDCIKTLGKKLIRQAHVIKRQKHAVEQYKMQIEALQEEMAMQDERDFRREEEYNNLQSQFDATKEQKIQMQNLLQENIEEMMDLKTETEKDAKLVMELKFDLQQKDATLDRVAKEVSDKSRRICEVEEELEENNRECESVNERLKESEAALEEAKKELENANEEVEMLRCKYAAWKTSSPSPGSGGDSPRRSSAVASRSSSLATRPSVTRQASAGLLGIGLGKRVEVDADIETFEDQLQEKDATIQTLSDTVKEHEVTIKTLQSDMVKMSSTYKQDSYLKRKEIAKLKQMNAEYALKLRALEKAFKCINANENMSMDGSSQHGSRTTHGGVGARASSSRELFSTGMDGSLHGKSTHSVGHTMVSSKEDKMAAVKARLGGFGGWGGGTGGSERTGGVQNLAPYEFPSTNQDDSQLVADANFFDGSDQQSEDERKGEDAGEK